jgi:hypothetical protein
MRYYIIEAGNADGPWDAISIIKKIRNHKIHPATMIAVDDEDEEPQPAHSIDEFVSIFDELENYKQADTQLEPSKHSLTEVLANAWSNLTKYSEVIMQTSLFLLASVLSFTSFATILGNTVGAAITSVFVFFFMFVLHAFILRASRGLQGNARETLSAVERNFVPLLTFAALHMLLAGIGLSLFIIPGILVLSLFCFVPLLIVDKNEGVVAAMIKSYQAVRGNKSILKIVIVTQIVFVLTAPTVILLFLVLPLIQLMIAELYDEAVTSS